MHTQERNTDQTADEIVALCRDMIRTSENHERTARDIVTMALDDRFDTWQQNAKFMSSYDLSVRYLDRETNDRDAVWRQLREIIGA